MATLSNNDIAQAIYLSFKDKKENETATLTANVIKFLVKKRLFSRSKDILARFEKIVNKEQGILNIEVSSIKKLDDTTKDNLKKILEKKYKAKQILFTEKIDQSLLGGIKIKVKVEVIDLTIFNKLKKLQEYLTR